MTIYIPEIGNEAGSLYKRLADAIERDVRSGILKPGQKLPTHREMADNLSMNVSTVTRAYREAESRRLLAGTVGRGTFVSVDTGTISMMRSSGIYPTGMIELGLVGPLSDLDPDLSDYLSSLSRQRDLSAYTVYGDPAGMESHRRVGASWLKRFGIERKTDDILITAGGQHALTCIFSGVFRPGQRIATECLTYPGVKTLAGLLGLRLVPISMDLEGMIPDSLETACRRDDISGVYLMPGVHNPTLSCMSAKRREAIADIAAKYGLILIEDDAYSPYREGQSCPISSLIPEQSVLVASVSKILWAGLRVAFVATHKTMRNKIAAAIHNTIWMVSPLNSAIVSMVIEDGKAEKVLGAKKSEFYRRTKLAESVFQGFEVRSIPNGGYIWLTLPEIWTSLGLESFARENGINLFSAEKFSVGNIQPPRAVRLSLTGENDISVLKIGLEKLADIISCQPPVSTPLL